MSTSPTSTGVPEAGLTDLRCTRPEPGTETVSQASAGTWASEAGMQAVLSSTWLPVAR